MKQKILREGKNTLLLLLWLLLVQLLSALVTGILMLAVELAAFGGLRLTGPTPLWEWIVNGVLIVLFWLGMGWVTAQDARPGTVGTVIVLALWAALTLLAGNTLYLLLVAQKLAGGMAEQILGALGCESWAAAFAGNLLLPAAFGWGLHLGWKHAAIDRSAEGETP